MIEQIPLPTEILQEIVNYLSSNPADLARCARADRGLGECALALLYRNVHLETFDGAVDWETTDRSIRLQQDKLATITLLVVYRQSIVLG